MLEVRRDEVQVNVPPLLERRQQRELLEQRVPVRPRLVQGEDAPLKAERLREALRVGRTALQALK